MNIGRVKTRSAYFALVLIALLAASPWAARSEAADAARGEYIVRAAGCISCHTQKDGKGEFLAGGRALVSPYGNFYSSNITPDAETGIGAWSDSDFVHAMRHGESPINRLRAGRAIEPGFPRWMTNLMTCFADSAIRINAIPSALRANPMSPGG